MRERKEIIAANWKMNNTKEEVTDFFTKLNLKCQDLEPERQVIVAPAFPYLSMASEMKHSSILIAAQDIYPERNGAYTGEVGSEMLKDLYVSTIIVGHSERRHIMDESLEMTKQKLDFSLLEGFRVILCVGETLRQREKDELFAVIDKQLSSALMNCEKKHFDNIIIAYEPVWAIGTGRVASGNQAQEMHSFIRKLLKDNYSRPDIPILYGGSVKPHNIKGLMEMEDIDGVLVGGASLKADSFSKIIFHD